MKIKNLTVSNQSVGAKSSIGSAHKKYMTIPGEATLELDDQLWLNEYAGPSAKMLEAGTLKIVKAPKKTDEQVAKEKEEALAAAKALIAEAEAKPAAKPAPKAAVKTEDK